MRLILIVAAFILSQSTSVFAEDCSKALIPETTTISYDQVTSYSLAYSLSESAWQEAQQRFGASAIVYGIPLGASYSSYHTNAEQKAQSLNIQDFQHLAYAYATSGINYESLKAYKDCLLRNGGLQLVAGKPVGASYTVWIIYFPSENARRHLTGQITAHKNLVQGDYESLQSQVKQLDFGQRVDYAVTLSPQSASQEATLDVRVGNVSRSLILPPLEAPPPPPVASKQDIMVELTGIYQVILGPRGGCYGGAPNSFPNNSAKIISDGTNLTAYNECGQATSVKVNPDGQSIYFYNEKADLVFSNGSVLIKAQDGNSWQKIH